MRDDFDSRDFDGDDGTIEIDESTSASVQVQASSDGISWDPPATCTLAGSSSPVNESFDLMPYASAQTRLRIVGAGGEAEGYLAFSWIRVDIN